MILETKIMNCASCDDNTARIDDLKSQNEQLLLRNLDKDETIRNLQAEVQMLGAKYRDMFWQRNTLHDIAMSEERTIRYRQITNE